MSEPIEIKGEIEICRMEELRLPPHLDGSQGSNRRRDAPNQLGATNDLEALRCFLAEYDGSPATQRAYRKEVERLLLWSVLERGRPLSSLTREDFAAYAAFLANPGPRWCGPRRGRASRRYAPGWRPFVGPLSPSAQRTALCIIHSMLSYLVQAGYLLGNPLALVRQRDQLGAGPQTSRQRVSDRCFTAVQWQALLDTVEGLTHQDSPAAAARARFWVALLHFLALRIGEAATHRMGDFHCRRGRWYFRVLGKGRKEAELPVGTQMLEELRRYRQHLGLPLLPEPDEDRPLLLDLSGQRAVSTRRASQVIKALLHRAASRLEATDPVEADRLRRASAHWFRHTALTRQWEKGIPLPHIKANARHARLDTTLLYVHTEEEARHLEIEKHTWT
ncbi:MAG: site-specific integrase [Myxococcales bacterium]|nr:site-specific integrase [Myxococcota bacterium]MDW8282094.1 site-specific integrase [Myxococcales bacterium]